MTLKEHFKRFKQSIRWNIVLFYFILINGLIAMNHWTIWKFLATVGFFAFLTIYVYFRPHMVGKDEEEHE